MKSLRRLAVVLALLAPAGRAQCSYDKLGPPVPTDQLFGCSLATDGELLVVGARRSPLTEDDLHQQGAASVFRRMGEEWVFEQRLTASDPFHYDDFGLSVAVSGDTILVGAPHKDDAGADTGAAYVFRLGPQGWTQEAKLLAAPPTFNTQFGYGVALDGDLATISSISEKCGVVRAFRRQGTQWTQVQKFTWEGLTNQARFGNTLDLRDGELFVGAPYDGLAPLLSGRVFHYHWTGSAFVLADILQPDDIQPGDQFGTSLARDGGVLVIGSPYRNEAGLEDPGGAYVYVLQDGAWTQSALLHSGDPEWLGDFGAAVAVRDGVIAVGEPRDSVSADTTQSGAVWRFTPAAGGAWLRDPKFIALDNVEKIHLGTSVAVRADEILAGAPDSGATPWSLTGEVLIFDGPAVWTDLGHALAGSFGLPRLSAAGELQAGEPAILLLQHAHPGGVTCLVAGLLEIDVPFKGGILVPSPDLLVPGLVVDVDGKLCLEGTLAAPLPPGLSIFFQHWIADPTTPHGFAASNALKATAP